MTYLSIVLIKWLRNSDTILSCIEVVIPTTSIAVRWKLDRTRVVLHLSTTLIKKSLQILLKCEDILHVTKRKKIMRVSQPKIYAQLN